MQNLFQYLAGGSFLFAVYLVIKGAISATVTKRLSKSENELELYPHEVERDRLETLLRQQDDQFKKDKDAYEKSKE